MGVVASPKGPQVKSALMSSPGKALVRTGLVVLSLPFALGSHAPALGQTCSPQPVSPSRAPVTRGASVATAVTPDTTRLWMRPVRASPSRGHLRLSNDGAAPRRKIRRDEKSISTSSRPPRAAERGSAVLADVCVLGRLRQRPASLLFELPGKGASDRSGDRRLAAARGCAQAL